MQLYSCTSFAWITLCLASSTQNMPDEIKYEIQPLDLLGEFLSDSRQIEPYEIEPNIPLMPFVPDMLRPPPSNVPEDLLDELISSLPFQPPAVQAQLNLNPKSQFHAPTVSSYHSSPVFSSPSTSSKIPKRGSKFTESFDSKLLKCPVCKKAFARKSNLNAHMRIHSDKRPFACPICKKTFKHNNNLTVHMLVHSDKKPFACPICKKTFKRKNNMNAHMIVHSDKKPFACPICKKAFNKKNNLITHIATHSDKKDFTCPICKKTFKNNSNLIRHTKKSHR